MADPQPMGGNVPEDFSGHMEPLLPRNCWAIDTLVPEVKALFDTDFLTSEPNQFNANLVVTFLPREQDADDLLILLESVGEEDERILSVAGDTLDGKIIVRISPNAILMDTRDSFKIDSAALGLDRELTPDDLTDLAADLAAGGEGFIGESS